MARTSTFHLIDRIVGGDLTERLIAWRTNGESYGDIAFHLRASFDVKVSSSTVARWCNELMAEAVA